jgi:ABC-type multidrug transport system ATPase subunit
LQTETTPAIAAPRSPVLSVSGLSKRFGHKVAIHDVTLDVTPGEVLGFVGPNGAGKTTTLRVLAGLLKADAGGGHVMGCDISTAHGSLGRLVGYMPQRLALYGDLSVAENLRFRAEVYELPDPKGAVDAAIRDFGLEPYRRQRASRLSGGWARRLQLAAALIHSPLLVLLDEPTAGLDAESKQDVWRRIIALAHGGVSVVINTHDLAEAEQCTRVALFSAGRIMAMGDPHVITLGAPFQPILASGEGVHQLAMQFEALDGVIATFPQGQHLRILFEPDAIAAVRTLAKSVNLTVRETAKRLEDAAFVLARAPEAIAARAQP